MLESTSNAGHCQSYLKRFIFDSFLSSREMEENRLHSVLAFLEAARQKYDTHCRMQLTGFRESVSTFQCLLEPHPSKPITKHALPVVKPACPIIQQEITTFVFKAQKHIVLPELPVAIAVPKVEARITRSRARKVEAVLPTEEVGRPSKTAKVQKAKKPQAEPSILATPVTKPVLKTMNANVFVFEQQQTVETSEILQQTPGFRNKCRLGNIEAIHNHTPKFEQVRSVEDPSDKATRRVVADEEDGLTSSLQIMQSIKVLERLHSCLTTETEVSKSSHRKSVEFLHSATEVQMEGTPALDPLNRVSGFRLQLVNNEHSSTPRIGSRNGEVHDKENQHPMGFWNSTGRKADALGKVALSQIKVLLESRKANQMARPPQDHRKSKNEASTSTKRTRRQLTLGCSDKMSDEHSHGSPQVAAELADLDNINSSITKRTPRLSKNFMEVRTLMLEERALILESQKQLAKSMENEELVIKLAQEERVSSTGIVSKECLQTADEDDMEDIHLRTHNLEDACTPQFIGAGAFSNTITPVASMSICTLSVDTKFLKSHSTAPSSVTQAPNANAELLVKETNAAQLPEIEAIVVQVPAEKSSASMGPVTYEISPYKESSDEEDEDEDGEDDRPQKPIPLWARKENLMMELLRLQYVDPEAIFTTEKSCSLAEVFGKKGSKRRPNFALRKSSGDWIEDDLTWEEELGYKVRMGYINRGD